MHRGGAIVILLALVALPSVSAEPMTGRQGEVVSWEAVLRDSMMQKVEWMARFFIPSREAAGVLDSNESTHANLRGGAATPSELAGPHLGGDPCNSGSILGCLQSINVTKLLDQLPSGPDQQEATNAMRHPTIQTGGNATSAASQADARPSYDSGDDMDVVWVDVQENMNRAGFAVVIRDRFAPGHDAGILTSILPAIATGLGIFALRGLASLLSLIGGFTRMNRGDVANQKIRHALLDALSAEPGMTVKHLSVALERHASTVRYHLRALHAHGLVSSCQRGKSLHYHATNEVSQRDMRARIVLMQRRYRNLAELVLNSPGTNQKRVCQALNIYPSRVHDRMKVLMDAGLVEKMQSGREVQYVPTSRLHQHIHPEGTPTSFAAPAAQMAERSRTVPRIG